MEHVTWLLFQLFKHLPFVDILLKWGSKVVVGWKDWSQTGCLQHFVLMLLLWLKSTSFCEYIIQMIICSLYEAIWCSVCRRKHSVGAGKQEDVIVKPPADVGEAIFIDDDILKANVSFNGNGVITIYLCNVSSPPRWLMGNIPLFTHPSSGKWREPN